MMPKWKKNMFFYCSFIAVLNLIVVLFIFYRKTELLAKFLEKPSKF